jgi:hypothetical protein
VSCNRSGAIIANSRPSKHWASSGGGERPIGGERLLRASRGALQLWLDAAKWWTGALAESAGAVYAENGGLLPEPAEALARWLQGRRIEGQCGGRALRATVESIQVYRGDRDQARLKLSEVDWDGLHIERLSVFADDVSITPPPTISLRLDQVRLEGRIPLRELIAWVDRSLMSWRLGVTAANLVEAVPAGRRIGFIVEPVVVAGELEVELREVRWRTLRFPLPGWVRLTRKLQLPSLPEGLTISEARRREQAVEFLMAMAWVSTPVDLRGVIQRDPQGAERAPRV